MLLKDFKKNRSYEKNIQNDKRMLELIIKFYLMQT